MPITAPVVVGGTTWVHNATDAVTTVTTATFTPKVGSWLVVSYEAIGNNADFVTRTHTVSVSGFTVSAWTTVAEDHVDNATMLRTCMAYAQVTVAAPGTLTVTRDQGGTILWICYGLVIEWSGVGGVRQSKTATGATTGTTTAVTLDAAIATGSAVVLNCFDAGGAGSLGDPTGYTGLTDRLENGDQLGTAYHLLPSSTTATWTASVDGGGIWRDGVVALELLSSDRPLSPNLNRGRV